MPKPPRPTGEQWTIGYEQLMTDHGGWKIPTRTVRLTLMSVTYYPHAGWVRGWWVETVKDTAAAAKP